MDSRRYQTGVTRMKIRHLLQELQRRRVVRVALIYGAAGFVVLQVADIIAPALHLPEWTMTFIVVLLAIALIPVLVLAWIVDMTPDGIEITAPAGAPPASARPVQLSRMAIIVPATLLFTGVMLGAGALLRDVPAEGGAHSGARAASVAVLPFADLSDDRSQEYFGDGVAEELLNTLRSADVDVASRTSSFAFKGRSMSLRQIAQELGVDHIIEGSVRKSGSRLRITAQVIDVRSDRQLWSQTFERDADDIFSIQAEIATAVADALRVRLAGSATASAGTADADAYDLYLLGLYHWNTRTAEGLQRATEVFTAATERDPAFARAWAGLAFTWYVSADYTGTSADRVRDEVRRAAERAVRLDPASAEARTALGAALHLAGDMDAAIAEYDRAIALDARFATAHHWRGILLVGKGRIDEGEQALRRARQLDPAALASQTFLGRVLDMQGRTADALAEHQDVLRRAPEFRAALIGSFVFAARLGRAREFVPQLQAYLQLIGDDPARAAVIAQGISDPAARQDAIAAVEAIVARCAAIPGCVPQLFDLVDLFALLGDREQTLRLIEANDGWYLMLGRSVFDFIRDEPRYQALEARAPRGPVVRQ
jgi:adenylate cyclase